MINKDTTVCISIAKSPGNFGSTFHNSCYQELELDWVYLPRKVEYFHELQSTMAAVRALDIRGCSVSMPWKKDILWCLNQVSHETLKIGATNTIVNTRNYLIGYNTDYFGAKTAIENTCDIEGKDVLMVGAGGVASAIGLAVKDLGGNLTISNRKSDKAEWLAKRLGVNVIPRNEISQCSGYLLINATSVGMNSKKLSIPKKVISNFEYVKDVITSPTETALIKEAKRQGKITIPGALMCVYQAAQQFELYTGQKAPQKIINQTLESITQKEVEKPNFILDVDGVMTTGQFLYSKDGKEYKTFGAHDSDGLKMIRDLVNIKFITADKRGYPISRKRIEDMGYKLELVTEGDRYTHVKEKFGFENTFYMGDGIFDAAILRDCMFGVAPKNARVEAKEAANFVTDSNSGDGAVCDACIKIKEILEGK